MGFIIKTSRSVANGGDSMTFTPRDYANYSVARKATLHRPSKHTGSKQKPAKRK